MLPLTILALRLLGFRRTQSALASLAPLDSGAGKNQAQPFVNRAHLIAKMVKAAAGQHPFHANCLQQSLVLWWLLRRQKIESELCLGVRKDASAIEAHAWVELNGAVLNGDHDSRRPFIPFEPSSEVKYQ